MKLNIIARKDGDIWKDHLMKYIEDHVFWMCLEVGGEYINDMPSLFCYIVDLKEEFLTCNKQYDKPFGFNAEYNHKKEGTVTITVGYANEHLTITEDKTQ